MDLSPLIALFAGAIATAGESKLLPVLQDLHDSNLDDYKAAVQGGYALTKHLKPLTDKSKTPVDDIFVNALLDVITTSASANGILLS